MQRDPTEIKSRPNGDGHRGAGTGSVSAAPAWDALVSGDLPTHAHTESDVTNLTTDLAGKAASVHTHAESDVTGLVTDLAGKAAKSGDTFTGTLRVHDAAGHIVDEIRLPARRNIGAFTFFSLNAFVYQSATNVLEYLRARYRPAA